MQTAHGPHTLHIMPLLANSSRAWHQIKKIKITGARARKNRTTNTESIALPNAGSNETHEWSPIRPPHHHHG